MRLFPDVSQIVHIGGDRRTHQPGTGCLFFYHLINNNTNILALIVELEWIIFYHTNRGMSVDNVDLNFKSLVKSRNRRTGSTPGEIAEHR